MPGEPEAIPQGVVSYHHPSDCSYEFLPWRGVSRETMQKFDVLTKINPQGEPISLGFPYGSDAIKVRELGQKQFRSVGDMSSATLFGKQTFSAGSSRSITITEGELDALSVYQMLGSSYPVVSLRSASSARKDCTTERDYLNSFERVYLCLDNDEPGQRAVREIAKLFDFNKVFHVQLSLKDANEYLQAGKTDEFRRIWHNSRRFLPEGIISTNAEFEQIIDDDHQKRGVPYPFPTLQRLTYGIRTSETILFSAMEGIGKTEVMRAIEYHLLKETDENIAIIHLEENKGRCLKGLAGYDLGRPVHLPDSGVSNDKIKDALKRITKRDERLHIYSHFGSSDPDVILDVVRFLASACGCRYVFLDHITMVVSGLGENDERKALDYISTRLAMLVEELDFCLIFVSHVNDEGRTRGSRNISKVAGTWVALERDKLSESERERNTTHLTLLKNRFGANTGPAGKLYFDLETFLISELDDRQMNLPPVNP